MTVECFLDHLSEDDRTVLVGMLATRRYGRDETVISHKDATKDVFFVLEGRAQAKIFSPDGKEVPYRDILAGEIFGELSAIDGAPRSASVVALGDLVIGRLALADFRKLVETRPSFTWALLRYFSAQARRMTERIFEFSTMLVRDRLIQELVRLAENAGPANGHAELRPAPTHFDLAARISTHREAVSREMSRLSKLGILSKKSGCLMVHDIEALRDMLEPQG